MGLVPTTSRGSSSGGLTALSDVTLGADTATIDTGAGGVAQTFSHLLIVASLRGTNASNTQIVELRFNADSGNNYSGGTFAVEGNSDVASSSGLFFANIAAASSDANVFSAVELFVPDYRSSSKLKQVVATVTGRGTMAAGVTQLDVGGGRWNSTAAITQVTLVLTAAQFKAGSRMTVYGI
jgi:hypothetical protein